MGIREGNIGKALICLGRALLETLFFHYGLKLRASIGNLEFSRGRGTKSRFSASGNG